MKKLLEVTVPRPQVSPFLVDLARRVGSSLDLQQTLEHIVQGVVDLLGFEVAVLNLRTHTGDYEVVQVIGPDSVRRTLLGASRPRAAWDALLAASTPLGPLCFLDHTTAWPGELSHWVPDLTAHDPDDAADPEAWHPEDALFAPLTSADGDLLGVLSVGCPASGKVPDERQRERLELFAVHASMALAHAQMHAQLERSEALLRETFKQVPVGLAVFSPGHILEQANAAYCAILGRSEQDLIGRHALELSHPDDVAKTEQMCREIASGAQESLTSEKRFVRGDGRLIWGQATLAAVVGEDGSRRILVQLEDITEARRAAADLERRALTDDLTGLSNRSAILGHLSDALAGPGLTAVLYCDLDLFKEVNDTLGHASGDELLIEVAQTLRSVMRPSDDAGRLGGDEFVLVLRDLRGASEALGVADRVLQASRRDLVVGDRSVRTSMTIGVALAAAGADPHRVLAAADRALYAAKQAGRDRVLLAP